MKPPGGNIYDRYVNDHYSIFQWDFCGSGNYGLSLFRKQPSVSEDKFCNTIASIAFD